MSGLSVGTDELNTDVHLFQASDGGTIMHVPLQGRAFRVSERARAVVHRLLTHAQVEGEADAEVMEALRTLGILGGRRKEEPRTAPAEAFHPVEATLIFTETCNLACTYCYASALNGKSKPMEEAVARAAVDLVIENAERTEQNLAMFRFIGGGEPTIEWDLLVSVVRYIRERASARRVQHWIRLITNGTLLTKERVDWIAEHIQFVTLSFDVLPGLQRQRLYLSGRETHQKLVDVVRALGARGVAFHLRTTISTDGAGRLEEMVRYVHENLPARSIRFEPLAEIGRSIPSGTQRPAEERFVASFKAAHRLGKELGIDVTCKMFQNSARRSARFCDTEFSVGPTGTVSACHRYSRSEHEGYDLFRIGQFDGERFVFDMDRLNRVRRIDVHTFEECNTCIARWNCAGGCLSARVGAEGVSQKGPLCELTRELLKYSIEEKLREAR